MKTSEVFGIAVKVRDYSYVDRANLDRKLEKLLERDQHIALKGASKSGKSWLRQKCIDNPIVVQCRLGKGIQNIYTEALAELGLSLEIANTESNAIKGTLSGEGEAGCKLLAKVAGSLGVELSKESTVEKKKLKCDLNNLRFIAELINASGRRLVIEDFHYLNLEDRRSLAYDLKTLWDFECFVIIIGVWSEANLLISLNPDLSARITEVSMLWSDEDLRKVIEKGAEALNVIIAKEIQDEIIKDSFGNVGILQSLLLMLIDDEADISKRMDVVNYINNPELYKSAAISYAEQLDGLYQTFAKDLSNGIRKRSDSTGIYAYTMQAIVEASDDQLLNGFSRDSIFSIIHARESRIQKGNLKIVLQKLEELQVDSVKNGLVVDYDESMDSVVVVDRQLLFYRKHHTANWPWEELAEEKLMGNRESC